MQQYKDLVNHVLTTGVRQSNRTGVDTLKCNGYMMKFDLAKGFPLLIGKRMHVWIQSNRQYINL